MAAEGATSVLVSEPRKKNMKNGTIDIVMYAVKIVRRAVHWGMFRLRSPIHRKYKRVKSKMRLHDGTVSGDTRHTRKCTGDDQKPANVAPRTAKPRLQNNATQEGGGGASSLGRFGTLLVRG